jgi:hypothetical protein
LPNIGVDFGLLVKTSLACSVPFADLQVRRKVGRAKSGGEGKFYKWLIIRWMGS